MRQIPKCEVQYSEGAGTFLDLPDAQVTLARVEAKREQTTFDLYIGYGIFQRATERLH